MQDKARPSAQDFLLAAKHCEIQGLEHLGQTCELVGYVSRLVHALQKERGISNVFLASEGSHFSAQRLEQVQESTEFDNQLRDFFRQLELQHCQVAGNVRQFSRIAAVLYGLDGLSELRQGIQQQQLSSHQATEVFTRLIGGLLAVVFEAADTSVDPDLTRLLVAMFNFMQGKELAGQERAWGARGFAVGHFDCGDQQRLQLLVEGQERCFDIFSNFGSEQALLLWQQLINGKAHEELLRLRQVVGRAEPDQAVPSAFSEVWYEVATARIDVMKQIEDQLSAELKALSETRVLAARADLRNHQQLLSKLAEQPDSVEALPAFWVDGQMTGVGRSLCELVQAQAQRLQQMGDQLQDARKALNERKLIEKAKGLLMQHRQLTEEQAWRQLRQTAMDQNRRLVEVAERVISTVELLHGSKNAR